MIVENINVLASKLAEDGKGLGAVLLGIFTGYGAGDATRIDHVNITLQHSVWTFTIIISILTIVGWIQKQKDRKREGRSSIFNLFKK